MKVNKLGIIIILSLLILSFFVVLANHKNTDNANNLEASQTQAQTKNQSQIPAIKADKIIVANFFRTQRCVSCKAIGEYTKKTLNERFSEELKSGKIELIEANVELPENKEIAIKYKASGSSLYINAIVDGKDDIEEDVTVWRLISNEKQFVSYLEQKLNKLLGK